jgi:pimeloyl-ACP methyl ester carboxylesterase
VVGRAGWVRAAAIALVATMGGPPSRAAADSLPDEPSPDGEAEGEEVRLVRHGGAIAYQRRYPDDDLNAWHKRVPQTQVVRIPSSVDGEPQRAIWYAPDAGEPRPLLVALHSWSADFEQNLDIPFAELAIENGWAFLHPDFRGPNLRPEATASELAIQDVLDAVAFAKKRTKIDPTRVYLVGYSGGAMKALVLAGKHPELWAGVAAWGAVHDIAAWYFQVGHVRKERHYRGEIAASCGGVPRPGTPAEAECRERSPAAQLGEAAGKVPILIAHGLRDTTVPLRHALAAFNDLAAPEDRFTDEEREALDRQRRIPPTLSGFAGAASPLFKETGTPVRFERRSRTATLVLFEGGHDMFYNASFRWLAGHRRAEGGRGAAP